MGNKPKTRVDQNGRVCKKCKEYKLWSEFYVHAKRKVGHRRYSAVCRKCTCKAAGTEHRTKHINDLGRECPGCKKFKPWSEFFKDRSSKTGHYVRCKDCVNIHKMLYHYPDVGRKSRLKKSYGISPEEYDTLYNTQKGLCSICGEPETTKTRSGNIRRLAVDHNHITGQIRGLLCYTYNRAIGLFKDSISIVTSALEYLTDAKGAQNE